MRGLILLGIALLLSEITMAEVQTQASQPQGLVRFQAPWTSPYTVDPNWPHHLVNAEGQHLFIMCRTGWAYFGCKDPEGFLDRTKALGCNVIRVALEGAPYFNDLGIDLWPWGGTRQKPDFTTLNEKYWAEVERRIRLAGQKGIGLDMVLYMKLRPDVDQVDAQRLYWQAALDRLGKYANILTWEIENENTGQEKFQDAAGEFFARSDPRRRPVCTSAGTTNDAVWPDKKWMSLAINHSCTGSGQAGGQDDKGRHTLDGWYLPVARRTRSHGKPAFCNESGREKRHKNDDGVHRRKQGWLWTAAGCFWNWHSWDGCEGIDDARYRAPGAEFVPMYARFWNGLPFWTLLPDSKCIALGEKGVIWTAMSDENKHHIVAYLCVERSGGTVAAMPLRVSLPPGRYRVVLLAPADLKVVRLMEIESAEGKPAEILLPGWTDDLLVRLARQTGNSPGEVRPMPG